LRSAFHSTHLAAGRRIAEYVLASFPSCPIPEIARLGRICASGASRSGVLRHRRTSESPEASGISTTTGSECSLIGGAFTDPRLGIKIVQKPDLVQSKSLDGGDEVGHGVEDASA